VVGSVPGAKFGLAFCESSGDCLVRVEGNDNFLKALAAKNALTIGAGHSFILFLAGCFPINVLNAVKNVQEVCSIYCATVNPVEVAIAESPHREGHPRRHRRGEAEGRRRPRRSEVAHRPAQEVRVQEGIVREFVGELFPNPVSLSYDKEKYGEIEALKSP
jgi:hypothetical protein